MRINREIWDEASEFTEDVHPNEEESALYWAYRERSYIFAKHLDQFAITMAWLAYEVSHIRELIEARYCKEFDEGSPCNKPYTDQNRPPITLD